MKALINVCAQAGGVLLFIFLFGGVILSLMWLGTVVETSSVAMAQDPVTDTVVITDTVLEFESPVPDPIPEDPLPSPDAPPLSEALARLIVHLGETLTGVAIAVLGVVQVYAVSFVRRMFPNDEKTATKINGGIAQIVAALTSIATALIAFGVAYAIGLVGSIDVLSLLQLASLAFVGGFGVHKLNKWSSIARDLKTVSF